MRLRPLFNLVFAVLLTAGLIVAPWAASPAAATPAHMAAMSDMTTMSADMPCCPDKHKSPSCDDCPLVGLCMLKVVQADRSGVGILARSPIHVVLSTLDDVSRDDPERPPPDHPPRSLV